MSTSADTPARADAAAALDVDPVVVDANDLRDATGLTDDGTDGDDGADARGELPLEADPADVAEQDATVPYDDEER